MTPRSQSAEFTKNVFISLLRQELRFRQNKNPLYSLRAFAKALDIDQSLLSKILSGQRSPSLQLITKAKIKLKLDLEKAEKEIDKTDIHYQSIEDNFHLISEWYHFALLELMKTKDFVPEEKWMSSRLGISVDELQLAVSRLTRLGYIKKYGNRWRVSTPSLTWSNPHHTTEARKIAQKQAFLMSYEAIDKYDFSERDHSCLVVAMDPSLVPEIKEKITQFRRSLDKYIESKSKTEKPGEVYHFTFSFHPISNNFGDGI